MLSIGTTGRLLNSYVAGFGKGAWGDDVSRLLSGITH
jgi:hypothetical protein